MKKRYDFSEAVVGKYAGKVARNFQLTTSEPAKFENKWRNPSVRLLAGDKDPIEVIRTKAKELVFEAIDSGKVTLPVDPYKLAESRAIGVVARPDIKDAQTVPGRNGRPLIEYNPARPKSRIRFSICHELAHTLFPDCLEQVRHRGLHTHHSSVDNELELLCNVAAAELLLPMGMIESDVNDRALSIDLALDLRRRYEASTEAVLLRLLGLSTSQCGVFTALAEDAGGDLSAVRYRIEYVKTSRGWLPGVKRGDYLPRGSVVGECTVVGTTAKGEEVWNRNHEPIRVEAVGTPPYPGEQVLPRIVGLIFPAGRTPKSSETSFELLRGSALEPRGQGVKIVAHVVNDATPNWGAGFGKAVQSKWPKAQQHFREKFETIRGTKLGSTFCSRVSEDVQTFQMVCQRGYGPSPRPRIRYGALRSCLAELRQLALRESASVHMPRIGTGEAGGSWELVSSLIAEELCSEGISVVIYDPPNKLPSRKTQPGLFDQRP